MRFFAPRKARRGSGREPEAHGAGFVNLQEIIISSSSERRRASEGDADAQPARRWKERATGGRQTCVRGVRVRRATAVHRVPLEVRGPRGAVPPPLPYAVL